ncbi:MAG TPA: gamma-glutamylcyclotransferase family protein [Caulobacteraceae bacterium]|nr:gamma-glutamylcyclotransferase family protein [Caulobacteraceae bacterium]
MGEVGLFSYGTLQLPSVQQAVFGRLIEGEGDAMVGWRLVPIQITDQAVIETSGKAVHTIARRTGDPADRIEGVIYFISQADLEAADRYEVDAYGRVEVELASGRAAFVYVGSPPD